MLLALWDFYLWLRQCQAKSSSMTFLSSINAVKTMKGLLFVLSSFILLTACSPDKILKDELVNKGPEHRPLMYYQGKLFTGVMFDVHWNGELKEEVPFKDGRMHGVSMEWYENGQLHYETNFKEGLIDGVNKAWYDNGQLHHETNYKDDKLDGISKSWNRNGQLVSSLEYDNGILMSY